MTRPSETPYAKSLRSALADAKITQAAFAASIGISQARVSEWCRGVADPSVAQVVAIDRALGLRPGTLLERAGLTEAPPADEKQTEQAPPSYLVVVDGHRNYLCRRWAPDGSRYQQIARFESIGDAERVAEMWNEKAEEQDAWLATLPVYDPDPPELASAIIAVEGCQECADFVASTQAVTQERTDRYHEADHPARWEFLGDPAKREADS